MTNKYTVKEIVEAISTLHIREKVVVCDLLAGYVIDWTIAMAAEAAEDGGSDLMRAIANWNLDFPAHKDDAILALLEELLEDALCQQQPGKETGEAR